MTPTLHDLQSLPQGIRLSGVTATPALIGGRHALRVELAKDVAAGGKANVDFVDMPTFVILPIEMRTGTLSVDLLARLNGKGIPESRAFAGLAFRITDGGAGFECIYLRPFNGRKLNPPAPRDVRAVQYFAYPEWRFDRLRETYPDGRYETGADIGPDVWINLRLDIDEARAVAFVNGQPTLTIDAPKSKATTGSIGLYVDTGSEAFFSNLSVSTTS